MGAERKQAFIIEVCALRGVDAVPLNKIIILFTERHLEYSLRGPKETYCQRERITWTSFCLLDQCKSGLSVNEINHHPLQLMSKNYAHAQLLRQQLT